MRNVQIFKWQRYFESNQTRVLQSRTEVLNENVFLFLSVCFGAFFLCTCYPVLFNFFYYSQTPWTTESFQFSIFPGRGSVNTTIS